MLGKERGWMKERRKAGVKEREECQPESDGEGNTQKDFHTDF